MGSRERLVSTSDLLLVSVICVVVCIRFSRLHRAVLSARTLTRVGVTTANVYSMSNFGLSNTLAQLRGSLLLLVVA